MSLPKLETGLVINYSFLWSNESQSGREEGVKDRPCAVAAAVALNNGLKRVYVLPITHSEPDDKKYAVEIPIKMKRKLGLDAQNSWIICDEVNFFEWPGLDFRFTPDKRAAYGILPSGLFRQVKEKYLECLHKKELKFINRDCKATPRR